MNVHAILGDGGAVAQHLPGYEARPQQLAMAEAVALIAAAIRPVQPRDGD